MDNNNKPKKHYRKRHYHGRGKGTSKPEAVAASEEKIEKNEKSETLEVLDADDHKVNENAPDGADNHHHKTRRGQNKNYRHGNKKQPREEKVPNDEATDKKTFSDEDEMEYSIEELDSLEENESVAELLMLDGTDGLDLVAEENIAEAKTEDDGVTYEVIGVKFGSAAKTYYFDPSGLEISVGNGVIVETVRGDKYGICNMRNSMVPAKNVFLPLKKVIRIANDEDKARNEENNLLAEEAFKKCNKKIAEHGLDMKLIEATYTHDRSKLIFFFTAPTRVDFRELVKDLAFMFKTRIDLRQIGIRDEAKMIGGYGICGRPLCCCSFLPNFNQVSIKMAKEQNLSLNTSKISGVCGRLMCCLKFEHKTYLDEAKLMPPIGSVVKTADGLGEVTEINPIGGTVKVKLKDNQDAAPKSYPNSDVSVIKRGDMNIQDASDESDSAK